MSKIKFVVLGEPCGKGRPRFVRNTGRTYTPKKTVNYETLVHTEYTAQCNGFRFPDEAMLDMKILAFYSIPKSVSKKKRALMSEEKIRPTKKPDIDNVMKMIADSLNQVAYRDDTQIVDAQIRKFYSEQPRIEVVISQSEAEVEDVSDIFNMINLPKDLSL